MCPGFQLKIEVGFSQIPVYQVFLLHAKMSDIHTEAKRRGSLAPPF
jgi:hypothetical protein